MQCGMLLKCLDECFLNIRPEQIIGERARVTLDMAGCNRDVVQHELPLRKLLDVELGQRARQLQLFPEIKDKSDCRSRRFALRFCVQRRSIRRPTWRVERFTVLPVILHGKRKENRDQITVRLVQNRAERLADNVRNADARAVDAAAGKIAAEHYVLQGIQTAR